MIDRTEIIKQIEAVKSGEDKQISRAEVFKAIDKIRNVAQKTCTEWGEEKTNCDCGIRKVRASTYCVNKVIDFITEEIALKI